MVTGGDDGALRLTLLSISCSSFPSPPSPSSGVDERPKVSIAASATLEGAHSSCALRGAWVGEMTAVERQGGSGEGRAEVVTVGLDQSLRGWAASITKRSSDGGDRARKEGTEPLFSASLVPLWSVPVQVPAPECLAVLPERGLVSVSGRGTQAFSWK